MQHLEVNAPTFILGMKHMSHLICDYKVPCLIHAMAFFIVCIMQPVKVEIPQRLLGSTSLLLVMETDRGQGAMPDKRKPFQTLSKSSSRSWVNFFNHQILYSGISLVAQYYCQFWQKI